MNELYHYGVSGMKWGVRKYQNEDGSLTPLGRIHYLQKAADSESKSAIIKNKKVKIIDDLGRVVKDASEPNAEKKQTVTKTEEKATKRSSGSKSGSKGKKKKASDTKKSEKTEKGKKAASKAMNKIEPFDHGDPKIEKGKMVWKEWSDVLQKN